MECGNVSIRLETNVKILIVLFSCVLVDSMESGCVSGAAVASTVAAALKFFAASQCLLSERWPPQANIAGEWTPAHRHLTHTLS